MADPRRLQQLRTQRDLIARHLAWLEEQITLAQAGESAGDDLGSPEKDRALPAASPSGDAARHEALTTADPDLLLAELSRSDEEQSSAFSKSGCWMAFCAVLLGGIVIAASVIYFIY